jgi:hypothetical protein
LEASVYIVIIRIIQSNTAFHTVQNRNSFVFPKIPMLCRSVSPIGYVLQLLISYGSATVGPGINDITIGIHKVPLDFVLYMSNNAWTIFHPITRLTVAILAAHIVLFLSILVSLTTTTQRSLMYSPKLRAGSIDIYRVSLLLQSNEEDKTLTGSYATGSLVTSASLAMASMSFIINEDLSETVLHTTLLALTAEYFFNCFLLTVGSN